MQLMHKGVFTNCTYPWMRYKSNIQVVLRRRKGLVAEPPTNETVERYSGSGDGDESRAVKWVGKWNSAVGQIDNGK